jgi:hypothetical protein
MVSLQSGCGVYTPPAVSLVEQLFQPAARQVGVFQGDVDHRTAFFVGFSAQRIWRLIQRQLSR